MYIARRIARAGLGLCLLAAFPLIALAQGDLFLGNGLVAGPLAGAAGSEQYFAITVPSGATSLVIESSGGTGDCDLYVRFGAQPTLSLWDYRPYLNGNEETITVPNPTAGTYHIMAQGYDAYAGVSLVATVTTADAVLTSGTPATGLSQSAGGKLYYLITAPTGATQLTVTTSGGTGDCDLYVRAGTRPTAVVNNGGSFQVGNSETVSIANPAAGTWYIMVDAYAAISGVTLTATATGPGPMITAASAPRQVVDLAQSLTIGVAATGSPDPTYQWKRNGKPIAGATSSTYTMTNAQPWERNGWYQVTATNAGGSVTSPVIFVNVVVPNAQVVAWGQNDEMQTTVPPGLTSVAAVASGGNHSLALKADGTVAAWGTGGHGQLEVPPDLGEVVAVSAGIYDSVALKSDGTVVAWGTDYYGQVAVPPGLKNVVAIAAGFQHTMALKSDGTVVTWGANEFGQLTVPPGLSNVVAIATEGFHSLALRADGTVVAWGRNEYGQSTVPPALSNVAAIAAGSYHSAALKADGTVASWGYYTGTGSWTGIVEVRAGDHTILGLKAEGSMVVTGANIAGEGGLLGGLANIVGLAAGWYHNVAVRNATSTTFPVAPAIITHPISQNVATGNAVSLTVVASGAPAPTYQWKRNSVNIAGATSATYSIAAAAAGDAGNYTVVATNASGSATSNVATLAVGTAPAITTQPVNQTVGAGSPVNFSVVATGAAPLAYQWRKGADNISGATTATYTIPATGVADANTYSVVVTNLFGSVTSASATLTVTAPTITGISSPRQVVTLGQNLALSVTATGTPTPTYQWKRNGKNLSNGASFSGATSATLNLLNASPTTHNGWYQVVVTSGGSITSQVIFVNVTMNSGQVAAWGYNGSGQTTIPAGLSDVVAVAAAGSNTVAVKADGAVTAWGDNYYGQTTIPAGLSNVVAVATKGSYTVALKADGTLAAWGSNSNGQTTIPAGLSNVVAVAAGGSHTVALKADGTVVAWGSNLYGQSTIPAGLSNVVAIAAGGDHTVAVKADGTVAAWGYNGSGQTTIPPGLSNVVAVAAGYSYTVALKADGTVAAWGSNYDGQTTIPAGLSNVVAVAASGFHNVALKADGSVAAWGYSGSAQTIIPAGLSNVVAVAAGGDHSVALFAATAPAITAQPVNKTVAAGTAASFSVVATGNPTPTYQWRKGGQNIPGATAATFTIPVAVPGDGGTYDVVVMNSVGSVTSAGATLVVNGPVISTLSSSRQVVALGQNLALSVTATGTPAPTYQWKRNGKNLSNGASFSGATSATLNLLSASPITHNGWYQVLVTNSSGTTTSQTLFVNVTIPSAVAAWGNNGAGQTTIPAGLSNVVAVAAGGAHTVALKADGTVTAWGYDGSDVMAIPAGLANVAGVAARGYHTVALKADGSVVAWGSNSYGQTTIPAGLNNVVAVAAGGFHTAALKADGTVAAWGYNSNGQTTIPAGLSDVVAVTAGQYHTVALKADGSVTAWGYNGYGQTTIPAGLSNVVAVAAGANHTAAMKADGTVVTWGDNSNGQTTIPAGLNNVVAIAAGDFHTVAMKADGTMTAWGYNSHGQATIPAGLSGVVAVAGGGTHSAALTVAAAPAITTQPANKTVATGGAASFLVVATGNPSPTYQWRKGGQNIPGATAATFTIPVSAPGDEGTYDVVVTNSAGSVTSASATLVVTGPVISSLSSSRQVVASGQNLSLSVTATGSPAPTYQWKRNGKNLSNGTSFSGATSATLNLLNASPVTHNGWYQVVVTNSGGSVTSQTVFVTVMMPSAMTAWGDNYYGQTTTPIGLSNVVAVATGGYHTVALKADGSVTAWGDNYWDQTTVPARLDDVVAVAAGGYHTVALKADGTMAAWGYNGSDQTTIPAGLSNVVAVAAGYDYTVALKADGTVTAWGYNGYNQTAIPAELSNVVAVAAGYGHTVALKADGTVVAWGYNGSGQTSIPAGLSNVVAVAAGSYYTVALKADGTVVGWGETTIPAGLNNVVAVAAGGYHTVALKANGTLVTWGDNSSGQTTIPAGLSNAVAVAAGGSHTVALVAATAPAITTHPANQTIAQGGTGSFSVVATGYPSPTYQWRKDGTDIAGATGTTHTITTATLADAGSYTVEVTNGAGSVVSNPAALTVNAVSGYPVISSVPPVSQVVARGANLVLSASVSGTPAPTYQWKRNGRNLSNGASFSGATSATLSLLNATPATHSGWYQLVASNAAGSVKSPVIFVNVAVNSAHLVTWGYGDYGLSTIPDDLSVILAIAANGDNSAVLKADGTVVAWGSNTSNQATPPPGLADVVGIASGGYHTVALKADGTVTAWGGNNSGQTTLPPGLGNIAAIAAGGAHTVALKADGTVVAWGYNFFGQTTVPPALTSVATANVIAIAAGDAHTVALKADGSVVAWGNNGYGQTTVPPALTSAATANVVAIAAGDNHTVALRANGTVVAWGDNSYFQATVPSALTSAATANGVAIAAGGYHTMALKADGTVVAWGDSSYGQASVPDDATNAAKAQVFMIAAGNEHSLICRDGTIPWYGLPEGEDPNKGVEVGQPVSFSFDLTGLSASLQWWVRSDGGSNWEPVSGAQSLELYIGTTTLSMHLNRYRLIATPSGGGTPITFAPDRVLTVNPKPPTISDPADQVVNPGGIATFTAEANYDSGPSYRWEYAPPGGSFATLSNGNLNGSTVNGARDWMLTISDVSPALNGYLFQCTATNRNFVSDTSEAAKLTVNPAIAWNPPTSIPYGTALNTVATAGGIAGNFEYSPALGTVLNVGANQNISVTFTPNDSSLSPITINQTITVTVVATTVNLTIPTGAAYTGTSVLASATTINPGGLTVAITYQTSPGNVPVDEPTDAGDYTVTASVVSPNYSGSASGILHIAKSAATVTLGNLTHPYDASPHPATATTRPGIFDVIYTYDGLAAAPSQPGSYAVVATVNHANYQGSASGTLLITQSPIITQHPQSRRIAVGAPVTFTAAATGGPAPTFQWQKDGVNIPGATNNSYTIAHVQAGDVGAYTMVATNNLGSATSNPAALTLDGAPPLPTADFNGDGKADILWTNTATGERAIWFMDGSSYGSGAVIGTVAPAWEASATGDFNGDGKGDIFWTNTTTGDRAMWLMNGGTVILNAFLGTIPPDWIVSGTGDYNGDGKADVLWSSTVTGDRAMWLMDGPTVTGGDYLGTLPVEWKANGAGDFNGDGKADILWTNTATGERSLWFMNGYAVSSGASLGTIPVAWATSAANDFDDDGKADILFTNTATGDRALWLMNGSSIVLNAFLGTIPVDWSVSSTGDFNGDGMADIFWTNTTTGDRAVWLMDAGTPIGGGYLGNVPTAWEIAGQP